MDVPVAANVLGTIGALLPQIVVNHRRHHTDGLQPSMMILWAIAGLPLGTYNIVEEFNVALQVQPQILTLLSLATWTQCMHYGKHWAAKKCLITVPILCAMFGGIQASLIFALRIAKHREIQWPLTMMAILSACLLVAGVLRHYWDIYVHRTVRGISFLFVALDAAGDLFSLVSILYQPTLDILGIAIYGSELVFWLGICACGGFLNFPPWIRKKVRAWGYCSQEGPERNGEQMTQQAQHICLREMPSSTSVFRTASGTVDEPRRRDTAVREP
ncbi:hypothetical protein AJ78_01370 [Emergomyces pasteurianus Ep9510]|uniref:PQ loop repeat protein n=1 Tax=Emergomyces pasteurianus Ep9510 TaxID=1447872 RepID=A0A1J9QQY7_9EURO|nr:hypothetical protein AJ78_01370 [Emergomyces pasteurianus Ep9510]